MKIYVVEKGIIFSGKGWEIKQKLKESQLQYQYVSEWIADVHEQEIKKSLSGGFTKLGRTMQRRKYLSKLGISPINTWLMPLAIHNLTYIYFFLIFNTRSCSRPKPSISNLSE